MSNHDAASRLSACEFMNKLVRALVVALLFAIPSGVSAQEHGSPAKPTQPRGQVDAPAHQSENQHPEDGAHGMFSGLFWPTVNFAILAGGLWWFFREPLAAYLTSRHESIRKELVEAANVSAAAAAQLGEIERKLQALPRELDALKRRGAEEIAADEQRIAAAARAERDRLLEQTRREIELQVRLAKRELVEHAADLSVQLAGERIQKTMTPGDQERLVDRYLHQVAGQEN